MLIFTNTRENDAPVIFLIEKKGKGGIGRNLIKPLKETNLIEHGINIPH